MYARIITEQAELIIAGLRAGVTQKGFVAGHALMILDLAAAMDKRFEDSLAKPRVFLPSGMHLLQ